MVCEKGRLLRRQSSSPVRMSDVALRANVSQMTVSRALRSPERVSEATRRAVRAAMQEIGYVPNNVASSLASNRSTIVAMIIPSITHSSIGPTIESLMEAVKERGLQLMIGTSGETADDEAVTIEAMLAQRPCGLILHNTKHAQRALVALQNAGIPVIETGDLTRKPVDMCVSYSNSAAAEAMTSHLIARGYRRIAIATVLAKTNFRSSERVKGYRAALNKGGIPLDPALIMEADYGFAGGANVMRKIILDKLDVDAVFFSTGILGLGALHECRRHGWGVPGRVAIAGFGHDDVTDAANPSLTTVGIPRNEIGRLAAKMLLDRVMGVEIKKPIIDVGFEVLARSST
jgi:LacI family gluconate utilization system Gnt-I transcriptional repressor